MEHPIETYIEFIFNNDGDRGSEQFFDFQDDIEKELIELELEENPSFVLDILHSVFTDISTYLYDYNAHQLSNALDYIFNQSFSNLAFCFQNKNLNQSKRIETISALFKVITHIYNQNAEPILGHLSEKVSNRKNRPLNSVCYMFWDTAIIPYNCEEAIRVACLDVMGKCARSPNIAVVEGAIHGLGHMIGKNHDAVIQSYIDSANFGSTPKSIALKNYAQAAKRGMIQ